MPADAAVPPAPDLTDIRQAAARIAAHVHRTPLLRSATLDAELGAQVFFKAENLQKIGAFKARGACNAVFALGEEQAARGVVTHSSGNHGAALAYAAARRGIPATVVMQEGASALKAEAVRGYGGRVVQCPVGQRQAAADAVVAETGAHFIHPFEDPLVIAGQATAALELLEAQPGLDLIVCPVGGGGVLAGTALVVAAQERPPELLGAEPEAVDDAYRSLRDGQRYPGVEAPQTLADGLLTGIGALPFAILHRQGVQVVTVGEDAIRAAAVFHLQRMKTLVEPSGATGLAALRKLGPDLRGRRVGVIITGGNTDLGWWPTSP